MDTRLNNLEKVANTAACSSVEEKADSVDGLLLPGVKPLIVLRDLKSRSWPSPMVYDSCNAALRQLRYASKFGKDVNTGAVPLFSQYPEDFELIFIGVFDSNDGNISASPSNLYIRFNVKEILSNE